jgi:hypothetical protein
MVYVNKIYINFNPRFKTHLLILLDLAAIKYYRNNKYYVKHFNLLRKYKLKKN